MQRTTPKAGSLARTRAALRIFLTRALGLLGRHRSDPDLDEEMRFHLEMEAEECRRGGLSLDEARNEARRRFGGLEQNKEAWRDQRSLPGVESWLKDLGLAVRTLRRSPGFALFAVLSLALGIGANIAIFTVFQALVLRPFSYPEPERLVSVWETMTWQGDATRGSVSWPNLRDWRHENAVFEAIGAYSVGGVLLSREDETVRVPAAHVEADVFRVANVRPALGRTLSPAEHEAGQHRVVVLSHGLWSRVFAADRGVLGRTIDINGAVHTIVGVMPEGFQFPPRSAAELWTPLVIPSGMASERRSHWLQVVARLTPGTSVSAAQAAMTGVAKRLEALYPENRTRGVSIIPLHLEAVRGAAGMLVVLMGAVGLILLLACANVAHLVLARAGARRRELAVRIALGAGRWRVVRLLSAEAFVLAVAGGLTGLAAARWALDALLVYAADYLPQGVPVGIDGGVLGACVALTLVSAILSGVIPALRASQVDLLTTLKDAGPTAGTRHARSHNVLMISEVALSIVLAAGAVLLLRSLAALTRLDLGFRPESVLTMRIELPDARFDDRREIVRFYERTLEDVRRVPGVRAAGLTSVLPVQPTMWNGNLTIAGRPADPPGREPAAEYRIVSPEYFRAMGISIVKGRAFRNEDDASGERVVIVNRRLAERYFPDGNVLGRRIAFGLKPKPDAWMTIVGVSGDVREFAVSRPVPTVTFVPPSQVVEVPKGMSLVVHTSVPPETLAETIQHRIRALDPGVATYQVRTMERIVTDSVAGTRFLSRLLTAFGALAIALALVGVYGVMSYLVSRRRHEMGVRLALGARPGAVGRLVLWNALRLAAGGAALGVVWSAMLGFGLRRFVIGITVLDPVTHAGVVAGVLALVVVGSAVPAWHASRVDPVLTLRDE